MDHRSGSQAATAEAHYSLRPSLTPKQQIQVNGTEESKMEQQIGNGTTSLKWNDRKWNNKLELQESKRKTLINGNEQQQSQINSNLYSKNKLDSTQKQNSID